MFVSSVSYRKMDLERMSEIYIQGLFQSCLLYSKMKICPAFYSPIYRTIPPFFIRRHTLENTGNIGSIW